MAPRVLLTVKRARALASRVRDFSAHAGRVKLHARLSNFRRWKYKKRIRWHTLCRRRVASCGALCMACPRFMYPSRRYKAIRSPETWRLVGENRAQGVDVGEDAARAPLACLYGESTVDSLSLRL